MFLVLVSRAVLSTVLDRKYHRSCSYVLRSGLLQLASRLVGTDVEHISLPVMARAP